MIMSRCKHMLCNFVNGLLTTVNKSCQTSVIFFNVFHPKDCQLDNILSNHIQLCSFSTPNLITNDNLRPCCQAQEILQWPFIFQTFRSHFLISSPSHLLFIFNLAQIQPPIQLPAVHAHDIAVQDGQVASSFLKSSSPPS